jgi:predicted ATPase
MQYLDSFRLPTEREENAFLSPPKGSPPSIVTMECYSNTNFYPFKLFPDKGLSRLDFAPITIFYGNNGSGKSTLLNVIGEKLKLRRIAAAKNVGKIIHRSKGCGNINCSLSAFSHSIDYLRRDETAHAQF